MHASERGGRPQFFRNGEEYVEEAQEMLKKGYLASTSCYVSVCHTPDVIDPYLEALDDVFAVISECEAGRPVDELLEGPVCHAGFKRLN